MKVKKVKRDEEGEETASLPGFSPQVPAPSYTRQAVS